MHTNFLTMITITLIQYYEKVLPLNREDVTDTNYTHAKRVCKNVEIKDLQKNHYFYIQSKPLLLADVFKNLTKYVF